MEPVLKSAYASVASRRGASVDDILIDPALRAEFLAECRASLGADAPEEKLLRRLSNLRKQSKLPRAAELLAAASSERGVSAPRVSQTLPASPEQWTVSGG